MVDLIYSKISKNYDIKCKNEPYGISLRKVKEVLEELKEELELDNLDGMED